MTVADDSDKEDALFQLQRKRKRASNMNPYRDRAKERRKGGGGNVDYQGQASLLE